MKGTGECAAKAGKDSARRLKDGKGETRVQIFFKKT